jgi:hypothetical protein
LHPESLSDRPWCFSDSCSARLQLRAIPWNLRQLRLSRLHLRPHPPTELRPSIRTESLSLLVKEFSASFVFSSHPTFHEFEVAALYIRWD